jgi:hypothetical protein
MSQKIRDYQKSRDEIKGFVVDTLKQALCKKNAGIPLEHVGFDEVLNSEAELMLSNFEAKVEGRFRPQRFFSWMSVFENILGAFCVFLILAILALVAFGSKQNPFDWLKTESNASPKNISSETKNN